MTMGTTRKRGNGSRGNASSPRTRLGGRRGRRGLEAAEIDDGARSGQRRCFDDGGGLTAPHEACVDEDVEDDEAQLLVQAIEQWRAGAPAMADRRRARTRWRLGFQFAVDTERDRERELSEGREEKPAHLLIHPGTRGGRAGARRRGSPRPRSLQPER